MGLLMASGLRKKNVLNGTSMIAMKNASSSEFYWRRKISSQVGEVPMNEKFYVCSPEEATKRSEESARSKLLFQLKHQCRASQVFVLVKEASAKVF